MNPKMVIQCIDEAVENPLQQCFKQHFLYQALPIISQKSSLTSPAELVPGVQISELKMIQQSYLLMLLSATFELTSAFPEQYHRPAAQYLTDLVKSHERTLLELRFNIERGTVGDKPIHKYMFKALGVVGSYGLDKLATFVAGKYFDPEQVAKFPAPFLFSEVRGKGSFSRTLAFAYALRSFEPHFTIRKEHHEKKALAAM